LGDGVKAVLKPGREQPFVHRHPWVFSGALHHIAGSPADGDELPLYAADGTFVAWGLFNSRSQIRLRLYSWDESARLDEGFFRTQLEQAARLRATLYGPDASCRLVFSEGDGLSGLTVDRYGHTLVVQFTSLALALRRQMLLSLLRELFAPACIVLRADEAVLREEGLELPDETALGAPAPVEITEHGLRYAVDPALGQKTGFYFDQRENRLAVRRYALGRACLDACCYTGGFAQNLAAAGAASVTGVDVSEPALTLARENAVHNGLEAAFVKDDVFSYLKSAASAGRRFGLIVLDPPKFARDRDHKQAIKGYISLNEMALRVLEPEGVLVTCSCSGRVNRPEFRQILAAAAHAAGRYVQLLEERGAAPDHPVQTSCPESDYLKCLVCRAR